MKKLTAEQKLALQVKKENRIEKLKTRRREKRKAKNDKLTDEQIAKKKKNFNVKNKDVWQDVKNNNNNSNNNK